MRLLCIGCIGCIGDRNVLRSWVSALRIKRESERLPLQSVHRNVGVRTNATNVAIDGWEMDPIAMAPSSRPSIFESETTRTRDERHARACAHCDHRGRSI